MNIKATQIGKPELKLEIDDKVVELTREEAIRLVNTIRETLHLPIETVKEYVCVPFYQPNPQQYPTQQPFPYWQSPTYVCGSGNINSGLGNQGVGLSNNLV